MTEASDSKSGCQQRRVPWRIFWGTIIAGVVVLAVFFGLAFREAYHKWLKMGCQHQLKQLGVDCRIYAAGHDGKFPSTWSQLDFVGEKAEWAKCLRCPLTGHETGNWAQVDLWADYRLLPNRSTNDPSDTVLAIEPLANHGSRGANVLFVDGSTAWWPVSRFVSQSANKTNF